MSDFVRDHDAIRHIPRTAARAFLDEQLTEKSWQTFVLDTAHRFGWWCYHPYDSRRSEPGWVDLVLLRPPAALFVELKRQSGKVSAAQGRVLVMLEGCGFETAVWRPSDEAAVLARLSRRP